MNDYPLPPPLNKSTAFLMVRVMKEGYRHANELFNDEKLRFMHYASAAYIAEYKDLTQKRLSELLFMDPSDIGGIVRELETAGYVMRQPYLQDRRRLTLAITPVGKAWLARREKDARAFEDNFLRKLTSNDRETLRKLLREMAGD